MSIQSEIDRLNNAKANIASAISSKGVEVAAGTSIDDMPALIRSIPQEGGGAGGDNVLRVTGEFNAETMQVENMSHSAAEIITAINSGKTIQCLGLFNDRGALLWIVMNLTYFMVAGEINVVLFTTLIEIPELYYVATQLMSNSSGGEAQVTTSLKIISTME